MVRLLVIFRNGRPIKPELQTRAWKPQWQEKQLYRKQYSNLEDRWHGIESQGGVFFNLVCHVIHSAADVSFIIHVSELMD